MTQEHDIRGAANRLTPLGALPWPSSSGRWRGLPHTTRSAAASSVCARKNLLVGFWKAARTREEHEKGNGPKN
jgi:hypothetical protein